MKKFLLIVFTSCSALISAQEILLETRIEPNTTYTNYTTIDMKGTMNLMAPEEIINASDNPFPMKMENVMEMVIENKTGKAYADGTTPVVMQFTKNTATTTVNGQTTVTDEPSLQGARIYGRNHGKNKFILDSISSTSALPAGFKETLMATLDQIQNHVEFPKEPMSIGNSFTQNFPMEMPVAGGQVIAMDIITEFTLKRIAGEEAFFDIKTSLALNSEMDKGSLEVSGEGTGSMIFNSRLHYYTSYITDMPMHLVITINDMMKITAEMETVSTIRMEVAQGPHGRP